MDHLNESEWRVMHVLWSRGPSTAREVLDVIEPETRWAYTTVKTVLARLVEKGAVTAEMHGHRSRYAATVTRRAARSAAVRALLDRAFYGTMGGLFHHLIDEEPLSARDQAELRELLVDPPRSHPAEKPASEDADDRSGQR